MTTEPRSWDPIPEPENWGQAILSDELYQRLIANPHERVPFLVNFARLAKLDQV